MTGMNIHDAILEGRDAAEAIMTDTMVVVRKSGQPTTDPSTGEVTFPETVVHDGAGRVQDRNSRGEHPEYPVSSPVVADVELQLPYSVVVRVNDQVTVTDSFSSPEMVDRVFTVKTVVRKTHGTMTRAIVEEVT